MQLYKSIYFPKEHTQTGKSECIRLAFNKSCDKDLHKEVKELRSSEVRALLGNKNYEDILKEAEKNGYSTNHYCIDSLRKNYNLAKKTYGEDISFSKALTSTLFNSKLKPLSGTFKLNKTEKIHRWYPYIEGYSCSFVDSIIGTLNYTPRHIYDPFSGSGTTQMAASHMGIESSYSEINPYMRFVIDTKVNRVIELKKNWGEHKRRLKRFMGDAQTLNGEGSSLLADYKKAFNGREYFPEDNIKNVLAVKYLISKVDDENERNLLLLALTSIAVEVSNMVRRSDLRYKTPKERLKNKNNVNELFINKLSNMISDIEALNGEVVKPTRAMNNNAKSTKAPKSKYDLVITSPPYVNGTNYSRNTKIELWLAGFIDSELDLKKLRTQEVVAGINNVSKDLDPVEDIKVVRDIVKNLEEVAYDKRIPVLVKYYFCDMNKVFKNLHKGITDNGHIYVDIGDSQFAGVHIPTDEIFVSMADKVGLELVDKHFIRDRYSKNGMQLKQVLLAFRKKGSTKKLKRSASEPATPADLVKQNFSEFRNKLPYRQSPYSKRNWGNQMHSLCSYQGKLKPAIAYFLTDLFTSPGMRVLDPLGGVGTIPFEACLNGRIGISNDISRLAYTNSLAKLKVKNIDLLHKELDRLEKYIGDNLPNKEQIMNANFGFNKTIKDYYHLATLKEIYASREYFKQISNLSTEQAMILSSVLHILHGNRPYALSRRSHSITPFAPKGPFEKKSLIQKTREKVFRMMKHDYPNSFKEGVAYNMDYQNLSSVLEPGSINAVITSPPFYSSTRFYLSNWIRMWFCGWDEADFQTKKDDYVETKQMKDFNVYKEFFVKMDNLLKKQGVLIMHLGRSGKFNMGEELSKIAKDYFEVYGLVDENVAHLEKFGVRDQGSTNGHQYLFLIKN